MPYTIDWEPEGVVKRFTGLVTSAELVASVHEIATNVKFRQLKYEISDYLGSSGTDFSQNALNEVRAMRISSFQTNPRIRVAIVTHNPEIQERIFSTIAAKLTLHQTRVFTAVEEANIWLGRATNV
jgi:hypothetical protein